MSTQIYQLSGGGTAALPNKPIISRRDPTSTDIVDPNGSPYQILQAWRNTASGSVWEYTGGGVWTLVASSSGGPIETINTNAPVAANYTLAGTANQIAVAQTTGTSTFSLVGPYTPATYTAHGVLMGEGTSSIAASSAGTSGQVFTSGGASADGAYQNLGVNSGLTGIVTANGASAFTANAVTQHGVLIGGASNAASSLGVAATGTLLAGVTASDPAFTASPSVTGNMTAATGFVATTAGAGITLNSGTTSGTTTATLNGRSGQITITTPSINAGAQFTFTITNSSVTASTTQILYGLTGGTNGAGLTIQSVTNSASQSVVVIQNASAVTNNTASLVLTFLVLN